MLYLNSSCFDVKINYNTQLSGKGKGKDKVHNFCFIFYFFSFLIIFLSKKPHVTHKTDRYYIFPLNNNEHILIAMTQRVTCAQLNF